MWKFICTAMLIIALAACHTNKSMSKTEHTVVTTEYTLPQELSVSASFRMLWNSWSAEFKQSGKTLDQYVPSEQLIKRFALRQRNNEYLVTGFLNTQAEFDINSLNQLGGYGTKYNDSTYSFAIPLRSLPQFVALPGIIYIEAAAPVRNR